jgi:hypothetical protein
VHVQAYEFVSRHVRSLGTGSVLEIGSLDVNGGVRDLFRDCRAYHGIDVVEGPGVDEVADAADWSRPDAFDVVVSTEVLEHAPRWPNVLTNAWCSLAAGGRLVMTCATDPRPPHSAIDGWDVRPGEWYENVPPAAVIELISRFAPSTWQLEVALDRGDLYLRADKPVDPSAVTSRRS